MANFLDSEAVFFFDDKGISNEMLYQEFEAFLDGMIGNSDLANVNAHAVYANINSELNISALVFFTIAFNEEGMADSSWNIPLRSLAEKGIAGPNMGAGPVKLFMKSGNESSTYADKLWDPGERGGSNDLVHLKNAIKRNRLCLAVSASKPVEINTEAIAAPIPVPAQIAPAAAPVSVSAAINAASIDNDEFSQMIKIIESQRIKITILENELVKSKQGANLVKELGVLKIEFGKLQEDKEVLDKEHSQTLKELEKLEKTAAKIEEQHKALVAKIEKEKNQQIAKLEKEIATQLEKFEKGKTLEKEKLEKHYNKIIQKREQEMEERFKYAVKETEESLQQKELQVKNLNAELTELRGDKFRLLKSGSDSVLDRIAQAGVNFITFKPGAGHLTIPLKDMTDFIENPNAYAAKKCNVSQEEYEIWLEHYQKTTCNAPVAGNKLCGTRVTRIDVPGNFKPGISDRCSKHPPK